MRVVVAPTDNILHQFSNQIAALSEGQAHMALARAVNRTVDTVKTHVVRALVKQTSAPRNIVISQLKTRKVDPQGRSRGNGLEGVITATGRELSLKVFGARQFSFGVRAKVWGKSQRFPGAFMGPRPGIIAASLGGHVFIRAGSSRFPIEKMFGPSIPVEMVKDQTAETFQTMAPVVLEKRVRHEIGRLLP